MRKTLAAAFACLTVLATTIASTPAARAEPVIYPTYNEGAHVAYTAHLDDCLQAKLYLSTVTTLITSPNGIITSSDHGEGQFTITDRCNLTPPDCEDDCDDAEPRPTILVDAALSPTKGPKVASLTLSSASYTERHPGRGDNPAVRVSIRWKATGKVKRGFERERSEYGLFLRTTAQRPAKATLTIEAGPYTVTGTATDAGIWQSVYTQL